MKKIENPCIVDVEASGFGSTSYPIEIGVVTSDDQRYCSLIKPATHWTHWDKEAESIHGISLPHLIEHGKPALQVALELNELLSDMTAYSDGWVVDAPWITTLFEEAGIARRFTVSPIESILSEWQIGEWDKIKNRSIQENSIQRHRASNDAFIIQQTYRASLAHYRSELHDSVSSK